MKMYKPLGAAIPEKQSIDVVTMKCFYDKDINCLHAKDFGIDGTTQGIVAGNNISKSGFCSGCSKYKELFPIRRGLGYLGYNGGKNRDSNGSNKKR